MAREPSGRYDAGAAHSTAHATETDPAVSDAPLTSSLDDALATIQRGLAQLATATLDHHSDDDVAAATLAAAVAITALAAQESRLVGEVERRAAYRADACITTASWLRHRGRLGWADARRRVARAQLMARMPALREAFTAGEVTTAHVDAVASRAVPSRATIIAEHDDTLTELARRADPRDVAIAVRRIAELAARDGADNPPVCSDEDLRSFAVRDGFSSLQRVDASVTRVLGELFLRVRDVYGTIDPPQTPAEQRRTAGQRFHDAVRDALAVALDHHAGSSVGGVKTHLVLFADLSTLLGDDERARFRPRLSASGAIEPELARHLIATGNPSVRAVLSLGPWLPASVGRAHRVLPPALRAASQLLHGHCRGPGCDRPFAWTEADHVTNWAAGGGTGLDNDVPLCVGHHELKHRDGWRTTLDVNDGTLVWHSPDGTRDIVVPPPDP